MFRKCKLVTAPRYPCVVWPVNFSQAAEQKCSKLKTAPPNDSAPRPSASALSFDLKARYTQLLGCAVPKGRAFGESLHTFFSQESMGLPRPEGQCGD